MDPEIQEAVKKCNPQKAILAMGDYLDKYEGRLDNAQTTADGAQQTAETAQETADTALTNANAAKTESAAANAAATKAEADAANALTTASSAAADASEAAENALDAMTQAGEALRASGTATTTANEALSVAQAADTLAGQAQNRANEAYTYAGNVETALTATNVDLNNLKTATNPAIKEISPVTNTSTVNLNLTRINGSGTVAMPVASATQAGVLNANDYKQMQDYAGRIGALEGSLAIYPVTLPSDNPSSEQITNAYTSQYPDAPNPPLDNTTVSDVTRKITYRYTSIGNTWIQVSYEVTQQFTNSSPGTIKGSTSPGMVSANTDGTGSLNGYDALVATGNASLNGLTAQGSATTISLVTSKNDGSQSVITLPQASNTQGGTISAVDYQKLQNSGVPIFTNEVLGAIKGSTLAGKISANADGTGTLNGYDDLATDTANAYYDLHLNQTAGIVQIEATHNDGTADQLTIPSVDRQGAGVLSASQYLRYQNSIKEISASQQPTEIKINTTRTSGTTGTSATITPVSDTQAGVMTPEMLMKLNSIGPAIPLLRISPEGNMAIARDNKGNTSFYRYFLTISSQILAGISYHQSLFWFSSIKSPIYDTDLGEGEYFTGISYDTVKPSEVTDQIDNAIKTWNANWYGDGTLYLKFRVHAAQMNSDIAAVFYYTPQFPTQDKYICEVLIQINGAGIQILSDTVNPDLVATDTVTIAYGATAYVLTLTYAGTTRPA